MSCCPVDSMYNLFSKRVLLDVLKCAGWAWCVSLKGKGAFFSNWRLYEGFCRAVLLSLAERGKTDNAFDQQPNHLAPSLGSYWKKPLFKQLVKHVSFFGRFFYSKTVFFPSPLVFHDAVWHQISGVSAQRPFLTTEKLLVKTIYFICSVFLFHPGPHPPSPLPPAPPVWVGFVGCLINVKKSNSPSHEHKTTSRTAIAVLKAVVILSVWRQGEILSLPVYLSTSKTIMTQLS